MTPVDLIAIAGTALGFFRGRKHTIGFELYRTLMLAVVLVAGCGLFSLATKALDVVPGYNGEDMGFLPFIGIMAGTWVLLRKLRASLRSYLEIKFSKGNKSLTAGLMGLARYGLAIFGILVGIELSPADFLTQGTMVQKTVDTLSPAN